MKIVDHSFIANYLISFKLNSFDYDNMSQGESKHNLNSFIDD